MPFVVFSFMTVKRVENIKEKKKFFYEAQQRE